MAIVLRLILSASAARYRPSEGGMVRHEQTDCRVGEADPYLFQGRIRDEKFLVY
jgi:hypothetical protein